MDFQRRKEKLELRFQKIRRERNRLLWAGAVTTLLLSLALLMVLIGRNSLKRRSRYLLGLKQEEISKTRSSMQWMMGGLKEYLARKNRQPYQGSQLRPGESDRIVAALKERIDRKNSIRKGQIAGEAALFRNQWREWWSFRPKITRPHLLALLFGLACRRQFLWKNREIDVIFSYWNMLKNQTVL